MREQTTLFTGVKVKEENRKKKNQDLVNKMKKPKKTAKRVATTKEDVYQRIEQYVQRVYEKVPNFRFKLIKDPDVLPSYLEQAKKNGVISFDTETTGTDPITDEVVGFSCYTEGLDPMYVPCNHDDYDYNIDATEFLQELTRLSRNDDLLIVPMANAPFDMRTVKWNYNFTDYINCRWDVNLAGKFLNENDSAHNLKFLWEKYILKTPEDEIEPDSYKKLFGNVSFKQLDPEKVYVYAALDSLMTWQVYDFQKDYLSVDGKYTEDAGLEDAAETFEVWNKFSEVNSSMMDNGVHINMDENSKSEQVFAAQLETIKFEFDSYVDSIAEEYLTPLKENDPELFEKIDYPLNPASSNQLSILFFEAMGLQKVKGTSVDKEALGILIKKYPKYKRMFQLILDYRAIAKLQSTYVIGLKERINEKTGKLHTEFKPYGAITGRLSSKNPNLQNIPARSEIGKTIRKMFIPSNDHYLIGSDFSQQEPRILAYLSGDEDMIKAYKEGKDLYADVASRVYKVPYEQCLESYGKEGKKRRTSVKAVVLGIIYGRQSTSIAEELNISTGAAKSIISKFYQNFPKVKQYVDKQKEMCRNKGFVKTAWGRKRRIPQVNMPKYKFKGKVDDPQILTDVTKDLNSLWSFRKRRKKLKKYEQALNIKIIDNGGKIAHAERQVINSIVQGSAADMIVEAMVNLYFDERFRELGGKLIITVHDEIIIEAPKENAYEVSKVMQDVMIKSGAKKVDVPMKCDIEIMEKWTGNNIFDVVEKEYESRQKSN